MGVFRGRNMQGGETCCIYGLLLLYLDVFSQIAPMRGEAHCKLHHNAFGPIWREGMRSMGEKTSVIFFSSVHSGKIVIIFLN